MQFENEERPPHFVFRVYPSVSIGVHRCASVAVSVADTPLVLEAQPGLESWPTTPKKVFVCGIAAARIFARKQGIDG
jgi:hypothetical protein